MTNRKLFVTAGGATAVAVAVLGGATLLGDPAVVTDSGLDRPPSEVTSTAPTPTAPGDAAATATATSPTGVPAAFTAFQDETTGLRLAYPDDWTRLSSSNTDIRLIASDDDGASLLLRVTDLGFEVSPDDDGTMKTVADGVVAATEDIELLDDPLRVEVDGVPGYRYIYSFADSRTGERGVHVHFFLFQGDRLITLVLEALPEARFGTAAETFDEIVGSLAVAGS